MKERGPSRAKFQKWFLQQFPSVKSKRSVEDWVSTLENLALINSSLDRISLTDKGKFFLKTRDKKIVYEALDEKYVAVHDILELLREKPSTLAEIASFLEDRTGVKWRTRTQYSIRLSWLQDLDCVTKNGRYYCLTEEGRNIIEKENEMREEHRIHRQVKDLIVETGQLMEYLGETEYKAGGYALDVVWKEIEEGDPAFVFEVAISKPKLYDALVRLKYARRRFGRPELYLITKRKCMSRANDIIRTSFREIADVIQVIHWEDIDELKEIVNKLFDKAKKIGFKPKIVFRKTSREKSLAKDPVGKQSKTRNNA